MDIPVLVVKVLESNMIGSVARHLRSNLTKNWQKCGLRSKSDLPKHPFSATRGNFSYLEDSHVDFFRKLLGESRVLTNPPDLEKYNVDWSKYLRGSSKIVLKPKTTEEVSQILSFCNSNRLAVCPQGGNTGLVGGSVPIFDEIVLSTELMDSILSLDENSGTLTCQAGCILQNLDNFLAEKGLIFPLDLGAKGSCQVGGNVSTNAGGLRLLRYGNLHGNVLGLEAVQANGEILDCLSTLKKDNTGYHLKHLFIGSEGTLGVVTKVAVQCPPRPKAKNVAFLGLQSFEKVLTTFHAAKQDLGEILSAFEVIDTPTMDLVNEHLKQESPIGNYPFYILMETSGSNEEHDQDKVNKFLDRCLKQHFVLNGTVTGEPAKYNAIWGLRERIPEASFRDGHVFTYDVSLPLDNYYKLVDIMKGHMGGLAHRVFGFGHLGDSNLHLQISVKQFSMEIAKHIEPFVFLKTKELGGSISAEHGVGLAKARYLPLIKSPAVVKLMKDLKNNMDPNGILNPYKIIS